MVYPKCRSRVTKKRCARKTGKSPGRPKKGASVPSIQTEHVEHVDLHAVDVEEVVMDSAVALSGPSTSTTPYYTIVPEPEPVKKVSKPFILFY